ncbi:MGDG synthase family glycosyltransferase [Ktedonospora formicarum]|uniref:Galactosyldiacylglycerol synthase n=1 Tax=Ktedonospora formicarum TaxID=2778364 RepID=A0A8J3MTW9_9CHLR|nr:glycosyltransferase [Ktedonospora formicarum]GHO44825.1 galactosyldiacylglycerol synthase [Ktedonospora formicarum]
MKQRTILFLIADTGAGHRSAANAITGAIKLISQREQEAWQAQHAEQLVPSTVAGSASETGVPALEPPTYRIEIVDVFEEYSRFPLREAVKLYGPTIRYNPKLFGDVFHLSNQEGPVKAYQTIATPLILNGLMRLITSVQPDIIVSIHPLLNHVTIHALQELGLKIPFLTVVTDLITVHFTWFAPGANGYIVPTEQAKQLYMERGLDPKRLHMLGMPIDPKFTLPTDSKEELRKRFGLQEGLPTVLLVGGGDGAGGLQAAVKAISQARLPVQLMVVTGRNRRLYAQLLRTRSKFHVPAKIFGFVHNMPELMRASDIIVTKAGPGTICEALSCDLPIILSGYVPGQEEGNVKFVLANDVGVLALDPRTLVNELRKLIKPGSQILRQRLDNARKVSRARASFDIANCILSYLPDLEAESIWHSRQWQRAQRRLSGRLRSAIRLRRRQGTRARKPVGGKTLLRNPVTRRFARTRDLSENGTDTPSTSILRRFIKIKGNGR